MGLKSSKQKPVVEQAPLDVPSPPPPPEIKVVEPKAEIIKLVKETRLDLGQNSTNEKRITIVIVSDTHNYAHLIAIPDADIFIHAGDFTVKGSESEVIQFNDWLGQLPHKHKVVVAGNHERNPSILKKLLTNCTFLADDGVEVEGLYIHGSKWKGDWDLIPAKTDILITHIPPDIIYTGESRGSNSLAAKVKQIQPKFHIFGHNHEGYGVETEGKVVYIGAATCHGSAKSKIRRGAFFFEYSLNVDIDFDSIRVVK